MSEATEKRRGGAPAALAAFAFIASTAPSTSAQTPPPGVFTDRPPAPIAAGATVSGALGPGDKLGGFNRHYVDEFALQGRRGDRLVLTLRSTAFAPRLSLSSAAALVGVAQPTPGAAGEVRLEAVLPADERYLISASTQARGEAGPYQLLVEEGGVARTLASAPTPTASSEWALWPAMPQARRGTLVTPPRNAAGRGEHVTADGRFSFVVPVGLDRTESGSNGWPIWRGAGDRACRIVVSASVPDWSTTAIAQDRLQEFVESQRGAARGLPNGRVLSAEIAPLASGGPGRPVRAAVSTIRFGEAGRGWTVQATAVAPIEGGGLGISCFAPEADRVWAEAAVRGIRPLRRDADAAPPRSPPPTAAPAASTASPRPQTVPSTARSAMSAAPNLMRPGQTMQGRLAAGASSETEFIFDARAGERFAVTVSSQAFDPAVSLFAPDGTRWNADDVSASDPSARRILTAPVDGRFRILARAERTGATGDYAVRLDRLERATCPAADRLPERRFVSGGRGLEPNGGWVCASLAPGDAMRDGRPVDVFEPLLDGGFPVSVQITPPKIGVAFDVRLMTADGTAVPLNARDRIFDTWRFALPPRTDLYRLEVSASEPGIWDYDIRIDVR